MKTKTSATLVLLLTFILGGITGALGYYLYARRSVIALARDGGRPSNPHHLVEELAQALSLDSSQKSKLEAIVAESRERFRTLSEQVHPQYEQIRHQTRDQIRQMLREEQKPRLDEFFKELDRRRANHNPPLPDR
jgi:uncharacterized membrane protein